LSLLAIRRRRGYYLSCLIEVELVVGKKERLDDKDNKKRAKNTTAANLFTAAHTNSKEKCVI
jgi:hypothetical protein